MERHGSCEQKQKHIEQLQLNEHLCNESHSKYTEYRYHDKINEEWLQPQITNSIEETSITKSSQQSEYVNP